MKAQEFVESLMRQTPSENRLRGLGFDDEFVARHRSNAQLHKNGNDIFSDELLSLIGNFNADVIEIGQVKFSSGITEDVDSYFIGHMESDHLTLSKITGEIQVFEHGTRSHVLYRCAINGAQFLDAMLIVDDFFNRCLFDDNLWENQDVLREVTLRCAELSGSENYHSFYADMLGYFG